MMTGDVMTGDSARIRAENILRGLSLPDDKALRAELIQRIEHAIINAEIIEKRRWVKKR